MRLKTVHISNRREIQSLGAATIKALSPNVFDRAGGIESKSCKIKHCSFLM